MHWLGLSVLAMLLALTGCSEAPAADDAPTLAGYVFVSQAPEATTGSARFFGAGTRAGCVVKAASGDCQLVDCSGSEVVDNVLAGSVRLSGAAELELRVQADGSYAGALPGAILAAPGESLLIDVSGSSAGVPALSGLLVAPADLAEMTVDGLAPASTLKHGPQQALEIAWAPDPTVSAYAGVSLRGDGAITLECSVPANAGELTLPPVLLELLADPSFEGELVLGVQSFRQIRAGDWWIDASLAGPTSSWQVELQ